MKFTKRFPRVLRMIHCDFKVVPPPSGIRGRLPNALSGRLQTVRWHGPGVFFHFCQPRQVVYWHLIAIHVTSIMSQTVTIAPEAPAIELENQGGKRLGDDSRAVNGDSDDAGVLETGSEPPPPHAQKEVEHWNKPKGNIGRLAFVFLSFIIAGMNDAAVGVRPSVPMRTNMEALLTISTTGLDPIRMQKNSLYLH